MKNTSTETSTIRPRLRNLACSVAFFYTLAFALLPYQCPAQQPPPGQSSLRVVNAVPGDKNVFISFDGQSIWSPGFTPGQSTAAVMFPAGPKSVKLECEGFAASEAKMDLPAGANCAMIIYPGEVLDNGPDKGKRRISLFSPPPRSRETKESGSKSWKILLLGSAKSTEVEVNGKKVLLTPKKALELPTASGMQISQAGQQLLAVSPENSGEFWIVVFPEKSGLTAVLLDHSRFDF